MLCESEIGEIKTQYRQAGNPEKQIGILADLYAVSKAQIREIVGQTGDRPRAVAKNEKARAKWNEQRTALLISMVDEAKSLPSMAAELGLTLDQVKSKLKIMGVKLHKTESKPKAKSAEKKEPIAPDLRNLQTERVAYMAFDQLIAEADDHNIEMSYCWRATIAEIDKIVAAWADKIKKHPDAEGAFACVIALLAVDALLERGEARAKL